MLTFMAASADCKEHRHAIASSFLEKPCVGFGLGSGARAILTQDLLPNNDAAIIHICYQ